MKKINKSANCPNGLYDYLMNNPNDNWDQFRGNDRNALEEVQRQLKNDQKGLCAYCEIDLVSDRNRGLDDFRVEHFHPKSPHSPPPNHSLNWDNLRAVCTGGNTESICEPERYTSPDESCDVPKGNKNLVGKILDPLNDIPAFPRYFSYIEQGSDSGKIEVDTELCPESKFDKAKKTIDELHLNAERLLRFRREVINSLRDALQDEINQGEDLLTATSTLANIYLSQRDRRWPAFFTCIRWYLGPSAESYLHSVNYDG